MRVLLFGATGMVGQGVLQQCLDDPGVTEVLALVRGPTGRPHAKLRELLHQDMFDLAPLTREGADQLAGFDACFFCLGVSSAGMKEPEYRRLTHDLTLAAARTLLPRNPAMTFVYVSGAGSDGGAMWARVKRQTEQDLLALGFKRAHMFRPGFIRPLPGVKSKTRLYRVLYAVMGWVYPLLKLLAPGVTTTSEALGRAMLAAARGQAERPLVETRDINALGATASPAT